MNHAIHGTRAAAVEEGLFLPCDKKIYGSAWTSAGRGR